MYEEEIMNRKIRALLAVGSLLFMCTIESFYEGCVNADNCTRAFKEYNITNRYTILYDGYHSLSGETVYSTFNSKLPDRFDIEYVYGPLTKEKLFSYDILIICTPIRTYSEEEINNIKQFVEEGGGLLLMGLGWYWVVYQKKPIEEYPLNQIAREFGVTANDDNVIDPTNQTSEGYAIFTKFASHPATKGLTKVQSGAPSSLSITGDAVPIVMGDEDSYSTNPDFVYEVGDYPPVAAALEYGKGKAVFMGHDILCNYADHVQYENIQFGVNIFGWFCTGKDSSEFPIVTYKNDQWCPGIYEDIVVWTDYRNNSDIHGYNISTKEEFQITTDLNWQWLSAIYGNTVVWVDTRNGNSDIYGYDLSTQEEYQITTDLGNSSHPAIYGNIVVWQDERNGLGDIYGYNLVTNQEFQITSNPSNQILPAIYRDIIVWMDARNGNYDIYGYNLSTQEEFQITSNSATQGDAAIFGNIAVWTDERNGNSDIYGYNFETREEFQITTDPSNQSTPSIFWNTIVWMDERNGNKDIYYYDLSRREEFQITFNSSDQKSPALYGDTVIWEDTRNGDLDIYGCNLSRDTSEEKYAILYDGYHSAQKEDFYHTFFSEISTQFAIECMHDSLTKERLFSCDILVISSPTKAYSEEEIYNIKQFVEKGGGLLLMGNGWSWVGYEHKPIEDFPFNQISREFGVTINDDAIVDPTNYYPESPGGPIFTNFAAHPVTEGLKEVYSMISCSLSITGDAIPVVMGDEDSYSGYAPSKPYKVGDYPPVAAALEYGTGKVVFLGHDCFISDENLDGYDNRKFGMNIFNWLSIAAVSPIDKDSDGYSPPEDCNDNDPTIYPGAEESCGKDYNCDGQVTACTGNLKIVIMSEGVGLKSKIYVDGTYEGETDSQGNKTVSNLEADKEYTIRVEKEGYKSEEKAVKIEKDTTVQIEVEMKKRSPLIDILFAPIPVSVFSFIITLIAFLMAFFKVDIEMIRRKFSGKTAPVVDSGEELGTKDLIKPHKKESKFEYDIAISFAGENRDIAKHLAEKLRAKEVRVFYDEFYKSKLWGKELTEYFRDIYGPETRFVVVLISEYYPVKDWTGFEFSIMRKEAERRKTEFILPIRLDDTKIEKIKEDVAYLDFQKEGIDGIVDCLLEKLEKSSEEEL